MKTGSASSAAIASDCQLTKRNAEDVSRSAEREEAYAASTAPPFEKGGRKLFTL